MHKLAFIGLGSMGLPMAKNIISSGFDVAGFDVNPKAREMFKQAGGHVYENACDAAHSVNILILMVVNIKQAEQILFEDGALASLENNATVILMATCPPSAVSSLSERVQATGRVLVDAPVSGGVAGAIAGSLSIMVAAPMKAYERILPVLQSMGDKVYHIGEQAGQGAVVKTVNQLLCGVHIAVIAEAFSLARKAGVDLNVLLEIMSGSAASSWMLKDRGPRMIQGDPEVTSVIDIFVKDLGIVLESGRDCGVALPLASSAQQMFLATSGRGLGKIDDSQVIQSYDLLNGITPKTNKDREI